MLLAPLSLSLSHAQSWAPVSPEFVKLIQDRDHPREKTRDGRYDLVVPLQEPVAQDLVDDLTTLMLTTGPGKEIMPRDGRIEISSVSAAFGISQPAAARLLGREMPRDSSSWEFSPFGRKYVFALERGNSGLPIDAWTINLNATALVVNVDEVVRDPGRARLKLFLILVHEWAINMDSKSSAFRYLLDLHEQETPGKAMPLKEFQGYGYLQESYTETSLRALRAFRMEDQFLSALRQNYRDLPWSREDDNFYAPLRKLTNSQCVQRVRHLAEELRRSQTLAANWNSQVFEDNMRFLEKTKLRVKRKKVPACLHLAEPAFGAPAGFLSEGPRPRIVGW